MVMAPFARTNERIAHVVNPSYETGAFFTNVMTAPAVRPVHSPGHSASSSHRQQISKKQTELVHRMQMEMAFLLRVEPALGQLVASECVELGRE